MTTQHQLIAPTFEKTDSLTCSVIVVCKDNLSEVKSTIFSVVGDREVPAGTEIIVVDDSANSDVENFVKSIQEEAIRYVRGDQISLYSAMNIGMTISRGKYLWFLNSGDFKSDEFKIVSLESETADIVYGNTTYIEVEKVISTLTRPTFKFLKERQLENSLPCHQSILFRRQFIIEHGVVYDTNLRISGDYKFVEALIECGASILYRPVMISRFTVGGMSNRYKNLGQVIVHAREIKETRNLSIFESLVLTLKLCRKIRF